MSPTTLERALSVANHLGYVFPKAPEGHPQGYSYGVRWSLDSSRDPEQIATWFTEHQDALIGIYTGKSGLVVVDIDEKNGKSGSASLQAAGIEIPPTFDYKTKSGGEHHYFLAPADVDLTTAADHDDLTGVDIRSGNGVAVYYGPILSERPTLAPAPTWALALRGATTPDAAPDATIAQWLDRVDDGKPSRAMKSAGRVVTPTGWSQATVKSAISEIVKVGKSGEAGARGEYLKARDRYGAGWPAKALQDWDALAAGSVRHFGLPPVTFANTPDEKADIARRIARSGKGAVTSREDRRAALKAARKTFRRWLGDEYDLDTLWIVLAAAAVERLDGDQLWLLIVGGPGGGKTETGMALAGSGARIVSSIASAGSLLSATSKGERSTDATGGLLREIGSRGLLFIKDFTTLMSANANVRAEVFAALREIYDGYWVRDVGTDGGRSLAWEGRLTIIGAVTTAWDTAHGAISAMGDRFALVRIDQSGRLSAGRQALANVGNETEMRKDLDGAVAGVLSRVDTNKPPEITPAEDDALLGAADIVTRARTAVESDYQGRPIEAHAAESPTRFAKQLAQVLRGAVAIGIGRDRALRLAMRVARDSMPPKRLQVLDDLAGHPHSSVTDVRKRLQLPHATVDRVLQQLHILGLARLDEEQLLNGTRWSYTIASDVDLTAIGSAPLSPFAIPNPKKKAS